MLGNPGLVQDLQGHQAGDDLRHRPGQLALTHPVTKLHRLHPFVILVGALPNQRYQVQSFRHHRLSCVSEDLLVNA